MVAVCAGIVFTVTAAAVVVVTCAVAADGVALVPRAVGIAASKSLQF